VTRLSQAFALAVPNDKVLAIRDDVGFFQAVRARIIKSSPEHELQAEDVELAIRQIISRAVASDEVIDIFKAAGLKKPDISILSDEFLADIQNMPQRNVAIELLRKLLDDEIKLRSRKNLVQSRSFAEMLERTIRSYQNRAIEVAEVVTELIELAREMREANKRGEALKLTEDELAFYDALEVNDSAIKVLGDDTLKDIARELVRSVRENATIGLDGEGKRARKIAGGGQAHPAQVWLSSRQAGESDADRTGAGGGHCEGLGRVRRNK